MKRTNSMKRNRMISYLPLFLLISCLVFLFPTKNSFLEAKEIEATSQWQVVEEGDTIPAGLHVKMNLETGEKLVKLLDDEKNEDQQKYYLQQQQSSTATAIMTNTGALATTEQEEKVKEEETNTNSKQELNITRLGNTQIDPETSAKITSQLLQQSSDADKKKQQ
mmetsp:Transcript_2546/g.2861  ORF Transcript_2546/g.2861 Transcript_2546/m.2861 type:complete len:165 (+) Transcript_2546:207-701(+)